MLATRVVGGAASRQVEMSPEHATMTGTSWSTWRSVLAGAAAKIWMTVSSLLLCVALFLLSWGVRLALWPIRADFGGAICAMVLVFVAMVMLGGLWGGTETFYKANLLNRVSPVDRVRSTALGEERKIVRLTKRW